MFSILEDLRGDADGSAIVMTNDRLLEEGLNLHAEEFKARFTVARSYEDAIDTIQTGISEAQRARLRRDTEEAISMLDRFRQEIERRVESLQELTDADLGQGPSIAFWGDLDSARHRYVEIESVKRVSLNRIDSAVWRDKRGPTSRILFSCICNAEVIARAPHLRAFQAPQRHFTVGQPSSSYLTSVATFATLPTEDKTLTFPMFGDIRIVRAGNEWKVTSLTLDKKIESQGEFEALMEARDSTLDGFTLQ